MSLDNVLRLSQIVGEYVRKTLMPVQQVEGADYFYLNQIPMIQTLKVCTAVLGIATILWLAGLFFSPLLQAVAMAILTLDGLVVVAVAIADMLFNDTWR